MLTGMHDGVFCYTFKCPGNRSKFDELWARPDNTENMHISSLPATVGRPAGLLIKPVVEAHQRVYSLLRSVMVPDPLGAGELR